MLSDKYKEKLKAFGKPVEEVINDLPEEVLLKIGKRVCSTDYAVAHYNDDWHPKFYQNKETLQKAIRRCYTIGAFNHKEQIIDIIEFNMV